MGGLEGSDGGIGADYGVGTIVWVRRRNGSWWPGRILGPEELSASHVMSPRSGTPVKLLGREDASVDWYNLEKSKRVKAFRCGEFDACIERAEASQGIPIKKREKYARREDAILHALELEKQQLEMKKQQSGTFSNGTSKKISGSRKRELHDFSSDLYMRKGNPRTHGKSTDKKSQMIRRKVTLPVGEEICVHKQKSGKQVSLEENVLGDMPRMRGLQDLGLKIFPLKRNLCQAVSDETSRKSVDNHVVVLSRAGLRTDSVRHVGGRRNIISSKNKRSQGSMIKESLTERSNSPVQALHRSAKLPVSQSDDNVGLATIQKEADPLASICQAKRSRCTYFPSNSSDSLDQLGNSLEQTPIAEPQFEMDSLGEECTSSIMVESSDSDSSETDYLEPDAAEDVHPTSGSTQRLVPVSGNSAEHLDCDPSGDEVVQISGEINSHVAHLFGDILEMHHPQEMTVALNSKGVSKWHMKGKRNIRHVTKRHVDAADEKVSSSSTSKWNGPVRSTTFEGKRNYSKTGNSDFPIQGISDQSTRKGEIYTSYDDVDLLGNDSGHAQTLVSQRHPLAFKALKDQVRNHSRFNNSDNASNTIPPSGWHQSPQRVCWDESYEHLESTYTDHWNDEWEAKLVDVNLKVQASNYQGEHVPLVSMMSRLNGKAIVGHPVQIETLEDGSVGSLLFRSDALHDGTTTPPVWRTGRRTAMQRVPRINPMTSALEDEGIELHNYPVYDTKRPPMKGYSGHFSHQAILSKKSVSRIRRSASKKVQQKLPRKLNLSSQKTRTLSSIATEHKLGGDKFDAKSLRRNKLLGGLVKSGVAMPLVTCVPVKVAFSRIMEAIGRPSYATAHRIRMSNSAVKNPSGS